MSFQRNIVIIVSNSMILNHADHDDQKGGDDVVVAEGGRKHFIVSVSRHISHFFNIITIVNIVK